MIMAVAMTVMLAIIGSTFVIMSRLDRQAVRRVAANQGVDVAIGTVVERIQKVLADDVVNNDPSIPVADAVGGFLDGGDLGDEWTSRETFDISTNADPWLANIEPEGSSLKVSEIWGTLPDAVTPNTSPATAGNGREADADGDGITDSRWRLLPQVVIPGKEVYAAVRIIDNCGMINVNTAWDMVHLSGDPSENRFGELLTQVDLRSVLARAIGSSNTTALDDLLADLQLERMPDGGLLSGFNPFWRQTYYQNATISRLANPHTQWADVNGNGIWESDVDMNWDGSPDVDENAGGWWQDARPFGIEDELELRNRFFLNTSTLTRLEQVPSWRDTMFGWRDILGQYGTTDAFRGLPFTSGGTVEWYDRLAGTYV